MDILHYVELKMQIWKQGQLAKKKIFYFIVEELAKLMSKLVKTELGRPKMGVMTALNWEETTNYRPANLFWKKSVVLTKKNQ